MQDTLPNEIVIVRRRPAWEGEAHPHGVWKIAYADFMTAMMAFFLVMWLINVTDDSVKSGVAQYFNPVKLASTAPNKKGLNDPNVAGTTNEDGANLPEGDLNAGNGRKDGVDIRKGIAPEASERSSGDTKGQFTQTHSEAQLFADPYAVLDKLAGMAASTEEVKYSDRESYGDGLEKQAGARGGDAFRDPFDPLYWQFLPTRGAGEVDFTAEKSDKTQPEMVTVIEPKSQPIPGSEDPAKVGDGNASVVAHLLAGKTAAHEANEAKPGDYGLSDQQKALLKLKAAGASDPADGVPLMERLNIALSTTGSGAMKETANRVTIDKVDDGVLISLTDDQNFGMFAIGSAEPRPELVALLGRIGKVVSAEKGQIVIKGHTDARPFRSRNYDNWRLSTARAHMALYMLARGGVPMKRFERVEGYADRDLKHPEDPNAASNRRIEIFLKEAS
ncbi:MotB family protein [Roseibium aggregatum]|uniref:MotB family protein n=1 Tax=Roseibium aggregatum TaxID=187304 RepID=A0A926S4R9_9HYPH|nr:MotB family protein [Roseibium aggregatum]MBD1545691.1 MotB family protein [Roseibium aggregatum]